MRPGTKRERLLDWIRNGDPRDVPVLLGPGPELAAAYLRKAAAAVTPEETIRVAELTGTHNIACLHGGAVPTLPGIETVEVRESLPDGGSRIKTEVRTPAGTLRSAQVLSPHYGEFWEEHYVKSEADFPALVCLIEKMRDAARGDAGYRRRMVEYFRAAKEPFGAALPTLVGMTPPAMTLMIQPYMDKEMAILTVFDQAPLMEHLMDCVWEVEQQRLEAAAANDVDIYRIAINGFEWLSPDLYRRYNDTADPPRGPIRRRPGQAVLDTHLWQAQEHRPDGSLPGDGRQRRGELFRPADRGYR